jgi:hypothetical protein
MPCLYSTHSFAIVKFSQLLVNQLLCLHFDILIYNEYRACASVFLSLTRIVLDNSYNSWLIYGPCCTCASIFGDLPIQVAQNSLRSLEPVFDALRLVSIRQHTSAYVSIRQRTPAYASVRQHTSAYASIRQRTSAYASIRQHTSAYVNIRQHTSAYVSTRLGYPAGRASAGQHTSGYVRIRQHTSVYLRVAHLRLPHARQIGLRFRSCQQHVLRLLQCRHLFFPGKIVFNLIILFLLKGGFKFFGSRVCQAARP